MYVIREKFAPLLFRITYTAVKAKASAPPPFNSSSSAALTRRALERVARTGGDAVAALRQTADRQGRQQGEAHGRQGRRTWGPLRRLQQSGPPFLPLTAHAVCSWCAEHS